MPVASLFHSLFLLAFYTCITVSHAATFTDNSLRQLEFGLGKSDLIPKSCLQMFGLTGERYTCGSLQVPEDYTKADTPLIEVPYMLISPDEDIVDRKLSPLLITGGGGPGNALIGNRYFPPDDSSFWAYEAFSVTDGRLLMILENRGVGLSRPNLDCHYPPEIYRQQYWSELLASDLACGREYTYEGFDLSQYNVRNAALDIEIFRRLSLRQGIAASTLNLYGISYGTRVAMYYERLFPSATRAMVLDSVARNDADSEANELIYAQQSLDRVFSRCRSSIGCREAFGVELEADFYRFLYSLEEAENMLSVHWPDRQMPIEVPLSAALVIDILHSALYSSDTIEGMPLMIEELSKGEYERFATAFNEYVASYSPRYYFSDTAFITYLCYDSDYSVSRIDEYRASDISDESEGSTHQKLADFWDSESAGQYMNHVCSAYGIKHGVDELQGSFSSDTPVLFLSGELDPVTPPASANRAGKHYRYHWNIVRKNAAHDVISHSACARFLASWFVYNPREDLDRRIEECEPEESLQFLHD